MGSLILITLCLIIVNGFYRENLRLLEERNSWQEKTTVLEGSLNELKTENQAFQQMMAARPSGVCINDLQVATVAFIPNDAHRLDYKLTVTVENTSAQPTPKAAGLFLFIFRAPGGNLLRTSSRVVEIPPLNSGEVKTLTFSGRVSAQPSETMLVVLSLDHQPGLAKEELLLPDLVVNKANSPAHLNSPEESD